MFVDCYRFSACAISIPCDLVRVAVLLSTLVFVLQFRRHFLPFIERTSNYEIGSTHTAEKAKWTMKHSFTAEKSVAMTAWTASLLIIRQTPRTRLESHAAWVCNREIQPSSNADVRVTCLSFSRMILVTTRRTQKQFPHVSLRLYTYIICYFMHAFLNISILPSRKTLQLNRGVLIYKNLIAAMSIR